MMSNEDLNIWPTPAPEAHFYPCLAEHIGAGDFFGWSRIRIHHKQGTIDAWSALPITDPWRQNLFRGFCALMAHRDPDLDYVVVGYNEDSRLPLGKLLRDDLCPVPGVVTQTMGLVDEIQHAPLRDLLCEAFTTRDAATGYWTCPASISDHHSYEGGLAHHSLEIATMVASASGVPDSDRDLGIAFALLHDFGKIWCYRDGTYTPEQRRGHVIVGREKLLPALAKLRDACPESAKLMDELLGGRCRRDNRRYPLAVGRVVHAFDQLSCEKTRRMNRPGSRGGSNS